MKDRVAAIRAERKGNVSPRASPTPSSDPTNNIQSSAVDPQIKTITPLEKVCAPPHVPFCAQLTNLQPVIVLLSSVTGS